MKNRLLIISLFLLPILVSGQNCRVDIVSLKARIATKPGELLYAFGDAVALNPTCIGEILEATIEAGKPDADALGQLVQLAAEEYPDKSSIVAETAILTCPEHVDAIRDAFSRAEEKRQAVLARERIKASTHQFSTRPNANENDEATKAIKLIDDLIVRLRNLDDEDSDMRNSTPVPSNIRPIQGEEFALSLADYQVGITTLNDTVPHDMADEVISNPDNEELRFKDPENEWIENIVAEIPKSKMQQVAAVNQAPKAPEKKEFKSSVYPIPDAQSSGFSTKESLPTSATILKSIVASRTSPRPVGSE